MSISGKKSITYRFKDLQEQETTAFGFKSMAFAHQATAGDTGIDLTNLITPSYGWSNPSANDLFSANLAVNRNNFQLLSSSRGVLIPGMSYQASATRITFVGFTADQDEVFYGVINANPRNGQPIVDARAIAATGDLAVGATDFNVGSAFKINQNSNAQVGDVVVFRNGQQQFRCVGNVSGNEGNYTEVNAGNGLGQIIRFEDAAPGPVYSDSIMVISNGLIAEKPDASQLAEVERINGGLERLIPYVASLAGINENDLRQYSPTGLDLKSFGDMVLTILDLEIPYRTGLTVAVPLTFTGTTTNPTKGTTTADAINYYRDGKYMVAHVKYKQTAAGTAGSGDYLIQIPDGLVADTTIISPDATVDVNFPAEGTLESNFSLTNSATTMVAHAKLHDSTHFKLYGFSTGGADDRWSSATLALSGTITQVFGWVRIPIVGWSDGITIREALGL